MPALARGFVFSFAMAWPTPLADGVGACYDPALRVETAPTEPLVPGLRPWAVCVRLAAMGAFAIASVCQTPSMVPLGPIGRPTSVGPLLPHLMGWHAYGMPIVNVLSVTVLPSVGSL